MYESDCLFLLLSNGNVLKGWLTTGAECALVIPGALSPCQTLKQKGNAVKCKPFNPLLLVVIEGKG